MDLSLSVVIKNVSRRRQKLNVSQLTGCALCCLLLSACGGGSGDAVDEPGDPAAATDAGGSDGSSSEFDSTGSVGENTSETPDEGTIPSSTGSTTTIPIVDNSDIEPPLGFAGEISAVNTPAESDPFSKFQLDDVLYTNNVYDGRQLDADNNWKLVFYEGVQDLSLIHI